MTTHNVALYADVATRVRRQLDDSVANSNPFYPALTTTVPTNTDRETFDWLVAYPNMCEWLGDRKFHQLSSIEFEITVKDWESGIQLPKKHIDDGRTGYFNNIVQGLASEASYHPDELLIETIENAQQIRCFDGAFFFDTNHSLFDSGVQSNLLTVAVADPAMPTEEEIRDIVELALTTFRSLRRDNGKPYMRPTLQTINDLLCVYPHQMDNNFKRAYQPATILKTNTAGTAGAAVPNFNVVVPAMLPLTERTGNYIDVYRTGNDGLFSPYVFVDRQPVGWDTKGAEDREYKDIKWFGDARYSMGVFAWYKAVRILLV